MLKLVSEQDQNHGSGSLQSAVKLLFCWAWWNDQKLHVVVIQMHGNGKQQQHERKTINLSCVIVLKTVMHNTHEWTLILTTENVSPDIKNWHFVTSRNIIPDINNYHFN